MPNLIDRAFNFVAEIHGRARDVVASNVRLDNENTALRRELAVAREARRILASDMYALSRGESVETDGGAAVEQRIAKLMREFGECKASITSLNQRERSELEAMRPVFLPISPNKVSVRVLLCRLRGTDLSSPPYSSLYDELLSRFEAYEEKALTARFGALRVWDTGLDKWTQGERDGDGRRYLGPCPACGSRTVDHGGSWRCTNGPRERGSCVLAAKPVARPQPFWWHTSIEIMAEEGTWAALRADRPDTKVGYSAGHLVSPEAAVNALLSEEYEERKRIAPEVAKAEGLS